MTAGARKRDGASGTTAPLALRGPHPPVGHLLPHKCAGEGEKDKWNAQLQHDVELGAQICRVFEADRQAHDAVA